MKRFASFIPHVSRALLIALAVAPLQSMADSPEEIAAQRQSILTDILTTNTEGSVATQRWVCANGQEPATVKEGRSEGAEFSPDASDSCLAALTRTAHDGHLPSLYSKLITELGGDAGDYEKLPKAIGASVLSGNGKISIGNGKVSTVTSSIAFDAGFSVAYTDGAADKGDMDAAKLKTITEDCLDEREDAGTCFSIGYVYGAQIFNAKTPR